MQEQAEHAHRTKVKLAVVKPNQRAPVNTFTRIENNDLSFFSYGIQKFIKENPYSTFIDLEDEYFEVARFQMQYVIDNQNVKIYLEMDSRKLEEIDVA